MRREMVRWHSISQGAKATLARLGSGLQERRRTLSVVCFFFCLAVVSFLWLDGRLLFFWDSILPFRPSLDTYYYSFTWGQLFGEGMPSSPFEFGSYFPTFILLSELTGFPLQTAEQLLVYLLFAGSGVSMFFLVSYLRHGTLNAKPTDIPAIAAGLFYMFNYYVAYYLLSQLFPSWFLYSLLPLAVLILIVGARRAAAGRGWLFASVAFVLVVQIMSAGFWEPPYLVYAVLVVIFCLLLARSAFPELSLSSPRIRRFLLSTLALCTLCSLWWLYNFTFFTAQETGLVTGQTGSPLTSILASEFGGPSSHPFYHLMYLLAIYPQPGPSYGNSYPWIGLYSGALPSPILLASAIVMVLALWVPVMCGPRFRSATFNSRLVYAAIAALVFLGLQGDNPLLSGFYLSATRAGIPVGVVLYPTNAQFLLFPLVFLYAITLAEGVACIGRFVPWIMKSSAGARAQGPPFPPTPHPTRRSKHWTGAAICVVVVVCVGIYPWYMWSTEATQQFDTANDTTIPSTVDFPPYVLDASNYIQQHATDGGVTLVLPEGYNFLSLGSNNSAFADTGPVGLITGTPVIFGGYTGTTEGFYNELNQLVYGPNLNSMEFANLLSVLNIEFVLAITNPTGAGSYPYYNVTAMELYLSSRADLSLAATYGPLMIYQNQEERSIVSFATPTCFQPSIVAPIGRLDELSSFSDPTPLSPSLPVNSSFVNGQLNLSYYHYVAPENPVLWQNTDPLNATLGSSNYLLVTFKTSNPETWFFVSGPAALLGGPSTFGETILTPLNPTPFPSQSSAADAIYETSSTPYTLVYPLLNQTYEPYSQPLQSNGSSLNLSTYKLGIALHNPNSTSSGSVQITSIAFAQFVSQSDVYTYLSLASPSPTSLALIDDCSGGVPLQGVTAIPTALSYSETNPTSYTLSVTGARGSFAVLFDQTYSSDWQLSVSRGEARQVAHLEANEYANLWIVNGSGNITLEVSYGPQAIYSAILLLSFASLILITVGMASWSLFSRNRARRISRSPP